MILPKLGLSKRKKLPCLWFADYNTYWPYSFFSLIRKGWNWTILEIDEHEDLSIIKHRNGLLFHSNIASRQVLLHEWFNWETAYRSPFPLQGKTVLDVGAGCGETALFFFLKGAKKVICIEENSTLYPFLVKNKAVNNWDMDVIMGAFSTKHLELKFDYCKMDIEGGEKMFLQFGNIKFPICLEVHSKDLERIFHESLGLDVVWRVNQNVSVMNNFRSILRT